MTDPEGGRRLALTGWLVVLTTALAVAGWPGQRLSIRVFAAAAAVHALARLIGPGRGGPR